MSNTLYNRYRAKDFSRFNDSFHEVLGSVEDFVWSPWHLRCVEFHFGQGHYFEGDSFGWHMHKELQLELIVEGSFRFTAQGSRAVTVKRGQVFVAPPGRIHRWKALEPSLMIGMSVAEVPSAAVDGGSFQDALRAGVVRPSGIPPLVEGILREFRARTPANPVFFSNRLKAWIFLVISQILTNALPSAQAQSKEKENSGRSSRSQRVVSKIIRFIDANIEGDLSMQRFEQAVGLSARQIHRIFLEVTGTSCHNYVLTRRLEIARSMLQADSSLSVKEVAYATGFASPAHFSATFRKAFGVTPSDYSPGMVLKIRDENLSHMS